MRTRFRPERWWIAGSAALFTIAVWSSPVRAQNSGSQVLKLPDPTPREMTPELRYHKDPTLPEATQRMIAAQNEKRWQLIVWATDELVVLSERAEESAQAAPGDAAKKDLSANVTKIETLAKSLGSVLKAR